MTQPKDGGPAFPNTPDHNRRGMSLRDWFAGQAISALLDSNTPPHQFSSLAQRAYEIADEAIQVRTAIKQG